MAQPRFGELLWQAIQQTRVNTGRSIGAIKNDLAELCHVGVEAVDKWKSRSIPLPDTVELLARWGVEKAGMKRSWLSAFLQAGDYYDGGALERQFFGDDHTALPSVRENLPPFGSDFIGRIEEINRVREGLAMPHPLISIEGMGGVGKTTLALKVARMCLAGEVTEIAPFETIVWMSAKDKPNGDLSLTEALDIIADVLAYSIVRQLSPEEKRAAVERLLRAHRTLVIVDNFETVTDPQLADFLQRVPPPSKAIITTRERQLRRLWDVPLAGLSEIEAFQKIRDHSHSLDLRNVAYADESILRPLVAITAGNPKAIEMALGYIKYQDMALDEVMDNLAEANENVDELFEDLFDRAWGLLSEEGRRLLLVMPFFADSASRDALASAADVHGGYLRMGLAQLLDLSLLETNQELVEVRKRYSAHPLVLAFAGAHLREQPEFEVQAGRRWCRYFLQFAEKHLVRDLPKERYWNCLGGRDLTVVDPERSNLFKVLAWVEQKEDHQTLVELMMRWTHYLGRHTLSERIHYAKKAAEAANTLGWKMDEALLRIDALGWIYIEAGRFSDAIREITTGLHIAQSLRAKSSDANHLVALAHAFLSKVYLRQKSMQEATASLTIAVSMDCPPVIQYRVNLARGDLAYSKGDYQTAINLYEEALKNAHQYGGERPTVEPHYRLGETYLAQGNLEEAEAEFKKILDTEQQSGTLDRTYGQFGLARVAKEKGEIDQARQLAHKVFETWSRVNIDHRLLEQVTDFRTSLEAG
ncbi:MAG: transcription activator GutR [Chloroflexota bacterium]|nr:MAG: transcription activator GutR [Chloroflexota bacterium]